MAGGENMRKVKILLVVLALALVACSDGSESPEVTVSDADSGSAEEVNVETEDSEQPSTTDAEVPTNEEGETEQAEIEEEPAQPTPTIEPTPTIPEPTTEPVDEETREMAGQVYSMLVMAQAAAEMLNDTAVKSQAGELESFEWLGTTIVIGALGSAIDEAEAEFDPPESLESLAEDTFELNRMAGEILGRWYNEEIYADDVLLELEPVLFHLEDVISKAEVVMEEEYGVDASELAQVRQEMMEELSAALESDGEESELETSETDNETQDVENTPPTIAVSEEYIEISGVGPAVTENFELDRCYKAVFQSTVSGRGFSTVELHSIDEGDYRSIAIGGDDVSQIELEGGTYFVAVETDDGTEWTVRGECQSTDEQLAEVAPAADPASEIILELEGTGPTVSDNIALNSCYKGVFITEVSGSGFSTVELHSIDEGDYRSIAIGGDDVSQIELEGGTFFLAVDAEEGAEWTVRGECQSTDEQLAEVAPAVDPIPEVFLELEGIGPTVSDNISLNSCYKGVFSTTIAGDGFSTVELHSIDEGDYRSVAIGGDDVNQIELEGGIYFVVVDAEEGAEWTVKGECGD
jgi:Ni,Fe-hydrogenase III component G